MPPPLGTATRIRLRMRRAPAQVTGASGSRLRRAVAQVVARDEPAHAVADDVEARVAVAAGVGQGLQRLVQAPRRLHEVAPPVVGEDVLDHARPRPSCWAGRKPDRGQQLEQVVVLGEPEQAGDDLVGAEQRARRRSSLLSDEGKDEGQATACTGRRRCGGSARRGCRPGAGGPLPMMPGRTTTGGMPSPLPAWRRSRGSRRRRFDAGWARASAAPPVQTPARNGFSQPRRA